MSHAAAGCSALARRSSRHCAVPALRAALLDADEGVRSFAATSLDLIDPTARRPEAA